MKTLVWVILLLGIVGGGLILGQELVCEDDCDDCQTQNCCSSCTSPCNQNCRTNECVQRCACRIEKCPTCNCTESEKIIEEEKNGTVTAVNNMVVIAVQTTVNNKNEIRNPVYVNSTNVNYIKIVALHRNETHKGNCCAVVDRPVPVPVDRPVPVYVNRPVPVQVPFPVVQKVPVPQPVPVPIQVYRPVPVPKPYPVIQTVHVPITVQRPIPVIQPVPVPQPVSVIQRVPVPQPIPVVQHVPVPQPIPIIQHVPLPQPIHVPCSNPLVCPSIQTSYCRPCYFCGGVYNPQGCLYNSECNLNCRQYILSRYSQPYLGGK